MGGAATGAPPLALTRMSGDRVLGANRIPPGPQAPPRPFAASVTTCASPPLTSIVLSLPSAKNPTARLSGAQKGKIAPSVPGSWRGSGTFMGRTQSTLLPSAPLAAKAIDPPSGDSTGGPAASPVKAKVAL